MDLGLTLGFWGVSALFCLTPGADWAYAMAAALKNRSPIPAILGLVGGHLLAVIVVAAGVGVIVAEVPWVLTALTVAGALYLIWLGVGMIRTPPVIVRGRSVTGESPARQLLRGFGVSGLNPKVYLLILVLLPQFVNPAAWLPVGLQMTGIGLIHLCNCALIYLAVGFGARAVLRTRPGAARIVSRLSGVIMIMLGLVLLLEKIPG